MAPGQFITIMDVQPLYLTAFPWKDLSMVEFWTTVCQEP